jgi:hypothetical protein
VSSQSEKGTEPFEDLIKDMENKLKSIVGTATDRVVKNWNGRRMHLDAFLGNGAVEDGVKSELVLMTRSHQQLQAKYDATLCENRTLSMKVSEFTNSLALTQRRYEDLQTQLEDVKFSLSQSERCRERERSQIAQLALTAVAPIEASPIIETAPLEPVIKEEPGKVKWAEPAFSSCEKFTHLSIVVRRI